MALLIEAGIARRRRVARMNRIQIADDEAGFLILLHYSYYKGTTVSPCADKNVDKTKELYGG